VAASSAGDNQTAQIGIGLGAVVGIALVVLLLVFLFPSKKLTKSMRARIKKMGGKEWEIDRSLVTGQCDEADTADKADNADNDKDTDEADKT